MDTLKKLGTLTIAHLQKTSNHSRTRLRISYRVTIGADRKSKQKSKTAVTGKEQ